MYVDGVYAGQVPSARALPSGEHRLEVEEPGHVPPEQTLMLLPGRHTELAIALEPNAQGVASVVLT